MSKFKAGDVVTLDMDNASQYCKSFLTEGKGYLVEQCSDGDLFICDDDNDRKYLHTLNDRNFKLVSGIKPGDLIEIDMTHASKFYRQYFTEGQKYSVSIDSDGLFIFDDEGDRDYIDEKDLLSFKVVNDKKPTTLDDVLERLDRIEKHLLNGE